MEPSNVNDPEFDPTDDGRLQAWLRSVQQPLPDEGFSRRVLAALPPPRCASAPVWSRPVACTIGLLAGVSFAWQRIETAGGFSPGGGQWRRTLEEALWKFDTPMAPTTQTALTIALAVAAVSMAYAFYTGRRAWRF